jgi:hypothetical protein
MRMTFSVFHNLAIAALCGIAGAVGAQSPADAGAWSRTVREPLHGLPYRESAQQGESSVDEPG